MEGKGRTRRIECTVVIGMGKEGEKKEKRI
jgi:hypothetical protein